jgi:hypothetical protein
MIFGEAVDAVARNNVFEAMLVESQRIDDGLGEDERWAPLGCLPVKEASSGPGEIKMAHFAIRNSPAVESILIRQRKNRAAVKQLVALAV